MIDHGLLSFDSIAHRHRHSVVVLAGVADARSDVIRIESFGSYAASFCHILVSGLSEAAIATIVVVGAVMMC